MIFWCQLQINFGSNFLCPNDQEFSIDSSILDNKAKKIILEVTIGFFIVPSGSAAQNSRKFVKKNEFEFECTHFFSQEFEFERDNFLATSLNRSIARSLKQKKFISFSQEA